AIAVATVAALTRQTFNHVGHGVPRPGSDTSRRLSSALEEGCLGIETEQHATRRLVCEMAESCMLCKRMYVTEGAVQRAHREHRATTARAVHEVNSLHRAANGIGNAQSEQGALSDGHLQPSLNRIPDGSGSLPGKCAGRFYSGLG